MIRQMKRTAALARIVLIDGFRRHALLGLIALAIAAQASAFVFFDFIPRDIGRASADFLLSLAWIAGLIFLFFHAVQAMALDEERKAIYSILARPLSRGEYVLGTFAGLASLLLVLNLLLGLLGYGTLLAIKQMVKPVYFDQLSGANYVLTWLGLMAMELMLLAVILLFSGLVRGSFPVLLISLSFYAICSGLPVVREAVAQQADQTEGQPLLSGVLQGMTAIFPDFDRLDYKNLITTAGSLPEFPRLVVNFGVTFGYISIFLWLACLVYQRRDLQ